jgi:hypothetical protein
VDQLDIVPHRAGCHRCENSIADNCCSKDIINVSIAVEQTRRV